MTSPAIGAFHSNIHGFDIFLETLAFEDFFLEGFSLDQIFDFGGFKIFHDRHILEVRVELGAISLPFLVEDQVLVATKCFVASHADDVFLVHLLNVILQTCQRCYFFITDVTINAALD